MATTTSKLADITGAELEHITLLAKQLSWSDADKDLLLNILSWRPFKTKGKMRICEEKLAYLV